MNTLNRTFLLNQLALLDAIKARPKMYLRDGSTECLQGIRDIVNIMYGYEFRGNPNKEYQFMSEFNIYLENTYPDIYLSILGMESVIEKKCDQSAGRRGPWDTFFALVADFRASILAK